jgi:hypothetical protein
MLHVQITGVDMAEKREPSAKEAVATQFGCAFFHEIDDGRRGSDADIREQKGMPDGGAKALRIQAMRPKKSHVGKIPHSRDHAPCVPPSTWCRRRAKPASGDVRDLDG